MKKHLELIILTIGVITLIVSALIFTEIIATAAVLALGETIVLSMMWIFFLPDSFQSFFTTKFGMFVFHGSLMYFGFRYLANSTHMQVSFLLMHILIFPLLLVERKRIRGKLPWQQPKEI